MRIKVMYNFRRLREKFTEAGKDFWEWFLPVYFQGRDQKE